MMYAGSRRRVQGRRPGSRSGRSRYSSPSVMNEDGSQTGRWRNGLRLQGRAASLKPSGRNPHAEKVPLPGCAEIKRHLGFPGPL